MLIISKLIYNPNPCFKYKASVQCFLITLYSSSAVSRQQEYSKLSTTPDV